MRARALRALSALLGLAAIALAALAATSHLYRVGAAAMEPTLRPGDRVVVPRWWFSLFSPRRGDIVAFRAPARARERCGIGGSYVQRIVALPGDRWSERAGVVSVNGRPLREPYVRVRDAQSSPGGHVPKGRYLLLGDNRRATCDSRAFGTVPRSALVGRVVAVYWPPRRVNLR